MQFYIRPALHKQAQEKSILSELIDEFQLLKKGKEAPRFGNDIPYHQPKPQAERANLRHTHILLKHVEIRKGTSDRALVYTGA